MHPFVSPLFIFKLGLFSSKIVLCVRYVYVCCVYTKTHTCQFSIFTIVAFCKVTVNTELANTAIAPMGNTGFGSQYRVWFLQASDRYITLFSLNKETPNLTYIVDSFT